MAPALLVLSDRHEGKRGETWLVDRADLDHPILDEVRGGPVFLVDVRPPDDLFLLAVLESPRYDARGFVGGTADVVMVDIGHLRSRLRFASGEGVTAARGLPFWLRTPRALTPEDVGLLRAAIAGMPGLPPIDRGTTAIAPPPIPPLRAPSERSLTPAPLEVAGPGPAGAWSRPMARVIVSGVPHVAPLLERATLPPLPPPPPPLPRLPPATSEIDPVFAEVLARPDDDAPRRAAAHALTERGDPRGDFIARQLDRHAEGWPPSAAELELTARYGPAWIGPLYDVLVAESIRFERGFLAGCTTIADLGARAPDRIGHPLWATVEELDCDDMDVVTHPVMRALRRATVTGAGLSRLARRGGSRLEAVLGRISAEHGGIRTGAAFDDLAPWREALGSEDLRLRELSIVAPRDSRVVLELVGCPLVDRLEVLDVFCASPPRTVLDLGVRLVLDSNAMPQLRRVTFRYTDVARRQPASAHVAVTLEPSQLMRPPLRFRIATNVVDLEFLGVTIGAFAQFLPRGLVLELDARDELGEPITDGVDELIAMVHRLRRFADVVLDTAN